MQLRFIFAGLRCNTDKAWSLSRRACVSERRLLFLRSRHGCLSVVAQGDAVGMTGYYLRVKSSWDGITPAAVVHFSSTSQFRRLRAASTHMRRGNSR